MSFTLICDSILNALYLPGCLICGCSGEYLCDRCLKELRPIRAPICLKCGKPTLYAVSNCKSCRRWKLHFDFARAGFEYDRNFKKFLIAYKYKGVSDAGRTLGKLITSQMLGEYQNSFDIISYVPLHRKKFNERGFNQSEAIAKTISDRLLKPVLSTLTKDKETREQNSLGLEGRKENIKGVFSAAESLNGQNILLVDDVFTTGTTVSECAKVLKSAGAKKIAVFTLAKRVLG